MSFWFHFGVSFGKELRFVGVGLGDFVRVAQGWIIAPTLWLKEVLDFATRFKPSISKSTSPTSTSTKAVPKQPKVTN